MATTKLLKDIIVFLPGITGSVLQKDGRDLWGVSAEAVWWNVRTRGAALQQLRLDGDDPAVDDLGDGITARSVIPDAHIIPGLFKVDGYTRTLERIKQSFKVELGDAASNAPANLFAFPYDWRRDNRVAARRLKTLIDAALPRWRERSGYADAKVILIAHSMGGLVARYYLEALEGWQHSKALITFATPYRGSANALGYLANGYKNCFLDMTQMMRSCTSVYQLLPIYEAVRIGESYHRAGEVEGIPNVDAGMARDALAFHREIERAVDRHQRDDAYLRGAYKTIPVVGVGQPTLQSADVVDGTLTTSRSLPPVVDELLGDGDGTVPRVSAIPIELSNEYRDSYVPERHGCIQSNDWVLNDLRGRLQQMQTSIKAVRGPEKRPERGERPMLRVDLDDAYAADEQVVVRAQLLNGSDAGARVRAEIEPLSPGAPELSLVAAPFEPDGSSLAATFSALPPGRYKLTVSAVTATLDNPPPVHDVFEIVR